MPPTDGRAIPPPASPAPVVVRPVLSAIASSTERLHVKMGPVAATASRDFFDMRAEADETTPLLPIGALAKHTGLTVEGIRFYEKAGILRAPARTAGQHRLYSRADLKRLHFIRRARLLGFTLDHVRPLLRLRDHVGGRSCADPRGLATTHPGDVKATLTH